MARLRRPKPLVETGVPAELLNPFLPLWRDDDAVQDWRATHGLPAYRWPALPGHRRRHGVAVSDWAVQQGLVDNDGHPDWRRLGQLLRQP